MRKLLFLTASPFFGGPERQMIELGRTFREEERAAEIFFASFAENGNAREFLEKVDQSGFHALELQYDMPRLYSATEELIRILKENEIDLLFLHGHKARLLGWIAALRTGIPKIGVSRGWTNEGWKIALYNRLDKWVHHRMDHIICVSRGQAEKVIRSGTSKNRVSVIHNSIRTERFEEIPDPAYRKTLESMFPSAPRFLLGAAGRLSPEKGFDLLLESVSHLVEQGLHVGLVLFGEGFLMEPLREQARELKIADSVAFAGFTKELDRFMPHFDVFVQSSHTEGLPNVLLEAMGAKTAVVATEVGGTAEVVEHGKTGFLVPPGDSRELSKSLRRILEDEPLRTSMEIHGLQKVREQFTFEAQSAAYWKLVERFCPDNR